MSMTLFVNIKTINYTIGAISIALIIIIIIFLKSSL